MRHLYHVSVFFVEGPRLVRASSARASFFLRGGGGKASVWSGRMCMYPVFGEAMGSKKPCQLFPVLPVLAPSCFDSVRKPAGRKIGFNFVLEENLM